MSALAAAFLVVAATLLVAVAVTGRLHATLKRLKGRLAAMEGALARQTQEAGEREAALRASNESLSDQNQDLTAKNRKSDELGRRRGAIVATLSHDLRSPLNSLLNLSALLAEGRAGSLNGEQRKYIDLVHASAQRLLGMVNDILDLSRIDAGRADLDFSVVDLAPTLSGIAQALWPEASKKDVVIRVDVAGPLPPVLGDADRITQVLTTLVRNGVRFTDKGRVDIVAEARGALVAISVTDTGVGMPKHAAGRIFQDFGGIDAERPRGGSTVLGLAIARRLIELMGGDLSVESEEGKGTSFTFTLPVAPKADALARAPVRRRVETPTGRYLAADVLVIDDDDVDRAAAIRSLTEGGFDAVGASSGREGLHLLAERPFNAVVLDLIMPELNGLDVLAEVGRDERLSRIPFVVMSSMYMTKMEREILGPSVVSVVLKGEAAHDDLVPAIEAALGEGGRPPPFASVLVVGPDVANRRTLEAVLGALPVSVVSAESQIEAVLACRRRARDLIIVDLDGPDDAGLQTAAAVRNVPGCESAYVVGLVSRPHEASQGQLREAGIHECLRKPVRPLNAVTLLTRLLDAKRSPVEQPAQP